VYILKIEFRNIVTRYLSYSLLVVNNLSQEFLGNSVTFYNSNFVTCFVTSNECRNVYFYNYHNFTDGRDDTVSLYLELNEKIRL